MYNTTYYLHYDEKAEINYSFLFTLFIIAERNKSAKLNNLIQYRSLDDLSKRIKAECNYSISQYSICRILKDERYNIYFTKSTEKREIILNIDFRRGQAENNKFVTLSISEV